MPKKFLLLLPFLIGLPLFATGALRRPTLAPVPSFAAEPLTLPTELGPAANAASVLDRAIERLSPECVVWLETKVHQRRLAGPIAFESEGTLLIGPNFCARLELAVRTGALSGRWLVVSDGHAYAHVSQVAEDAPVIVSGLLALAPDADQPASRPPAERLRELGCGGPLPLLQDLRSRLRDLTAQAGRYLGRPVVRIQGRLAGGAFAENTAIRADFCYVYFDACALWPSRIEWWVANPRDAPRLQLEIDFRDPQLNRALSLEECTQAFTYRPESSQ
jgi:hypothetical protein